MQPREMHLPGSAGRQCRVGIFAHVVSRNHERNPLSLDHTSITHHSLDFFAEACCGTAQDVVAVAELKWLLDLDTHLDFAVQVLHLHIDFVVSVRRCGEG